VCLNELGASRSPRTKVRTGVVVALSGRRRCGGVHRRSMRIVVKVRTLTVFLNQDTPKRHQDNATPPSVETVAGGAESLSREGLQNPGYLLVVLLRQKFTRKVARQRELDSTRLRPQFRSQPSLSFLMISRGLLRILISRRAFSDRQLWRRCISAGQKILLSRDAGQRAKRAIDLNQWLASANRRAS
jgi:hypothetical protein